MQWQQQRRIAAAGRTGPRWSEAGGLLRKRSPAAVPEERAGSSPSSRALLLHSPP